MATAGPAPKRAHAANFLNAAMVGWSLGQRPFRLMHSVPTPSQVFVASPLGTSNSSNSFDPRAAILSFVMLISSIFFTQQLGSVGVGFETVGLRFVWRFLSHFFLPPSPKRTNS